MTRTFRLAVVAVGLCSSSLAFAAPIVPASPEFLPANGSVVPKNTKIWFFPQSGGGTTGLLQLHDPSGALVELTATSIAIPPFSAFEKWTPKAELAPGRYELEDIGNPLASFTVKDELDTTPPPKPEVQVTTTGKVGSMLSTVTVTGSTTPDSFLVIMGEPQSWEPASVYAVGTKGTATVMDLREGEHRLKVVRVDLAGNASEPSEVVITVPKDRACSVAPALPLSLLALMLLRRSISRNRSRLRFGENHGSN